MCFTYRNNPLQCPQDPNTDRGGFEGQIAQVIKKADTIGGDDLKATSNRRSPAR